MFEDILGKRKSTGDIWKLYINEKKYPIKVFNVTIENNIPIEGFITNNTYVIDDYTNYEIVIPGNKTIDKKTVKVIMERINKNTLRFYIIQ